MNINRTRSVYTYFVIVTLVCMTALPFADAAFFYKSYVIRYDRGWNILCDPYVVKKDDWVFKLFRQKGEISNKDFPEFLRIFKRLNPNIQDLDRIRPGQHIVIPLKKVNQDDLPETSSDIVTIPYVTGAALPEDAAKHSINYRVKKGDCVSVLISERFGKYGSSSYLEGEKLFHEINPQIENLNLIYAGQMIRLPEPNSQKQPKPNPTLDGEAVHQNKKKEPFETPVTLDEKLSVSSADADNRQKQTDSPLSKVATVLDARLFNKGDYYLPRPGQEDYKIDLSQTPFIKLEDGKRIFFIPDEKKKDSDIKMIKSYWKDALIVTLEPDGSLEKIFNTVFGSLEENVVNHRLSFSDHGVDVDVQGKWIIEKPHDRGEAVRHLCIAVIDDLKERTPQSIVRYLDQHNIIIKEILIGRLFKAPASNISGSNLEDKKPYNIDTSDHETFIKNFLSAMGYQYSPNENISFQYAGIPINAASNLASKNDNNFYIDFGNLYGDALHAIEISGHSVIQVKDKDSLDDITEKLLGAMKASFIKDPTFLAAKRPAHYNTRLTVPGYLVGHEDSQILLTTVPLDLQVIRFLTDNDIRIIRMSLKDKNNE